MQQIDGGISGTIPAFANIYYNEEENIDGIYAMTNGKTFVVDLPMMNTSKTVYERLMEYDECTEFMNLLSNEKMADIVMTCIDPVTNQILTSTTLQKYLIFAKDPSYSSFTDVVRFFSTYNYTIYIPNNAAVRQAVQDGVIYTWDTIEAEENDSIRGVMVQNLNRYLRYHFQDNSVFADNTAFSNEYETAALDPENRFYRLAVQGDGNGAITVTDNAKNKANVLQKNIMARDLKYNGTAAASIGSVQTSAFAVIHIIDRVLDINAK